MAQWKEYAGYKINEKGSVIGMSGKIIRGSKNTKGYMQTQGPNKKKILLHRLIAECWLECPGDFEHFEVNHIDGNKHNNSPTNLQWISKEDHRTTDAMRRTESNKIYLKNCNMNIMDKSIYTIAFDLGGVIFDSCNDTDIFSKNYKNISLIEGIYDLIVFLSQKDNYKLIIISKAYPNNAKKSKEILKLYGLDDVFNSIIFCENKNDKVKIASAMNVNVMIDDRQDVINTFKETKIKAILFDRQKIDELYKL